MLNLVVDEVDLNGDKYTGVACNIGVLNEQEAAIDRFPLALVPSPTVGTAPLGTVNRWWYITMHF